MQLTSPWHRHGRCRCCLFYQQMGSSADCCCYCRHCCCYWALSRRQLAGSQPRRQRQTQNLPTFSSSRFHLRRCLRPPLHRYRRNARCRIRPPGYPRRPTAPALSRGDRSLHVHTQRDPASPLHRHPCRPALASRSRLPVWIFRHWPPASPRQIRGGPRPRVGRGTPRGRRDASTAQTSGHEVVPPLCAGRQFLAVALEDFERALSEPE
mmetsp:Transcript_51828/g.110121  ORF Transcript_51828/g.110121 Transcript_51828/m.110121 type:complete len:209 (+) Transcript_51828:494-1120(+)